MTKTQYKILIIKQAGILDKMREMSDLGGNSIFAPANIKKLSLDRYMAGSYYLMVENEHLGRPVKIGTMTISNIYKLQNSIDKYNQVKKADMPNIIENPLYYIVNNHLRLENFRTVAYNDLQRAFFKGRSAKSAMEAVEVEAGPNYSHGQADFVRNDRSELLTFASTKAKYRTLIASLAKSK